jgi:hypothetical protein
MPARIFNIFARHLVRLSEYDKKAVSYSNLMHGIGEKGFQ